MFASRNRTLPISATANAFGPRTGRLLPLPAAQYDVQSSPKHTVLNEHMCMTDQLRQFHKAINEEPSQLSIGFFRASNIEQVHRDIINAVASASRGAYRISKQSQSEVELLMVYVYQNNAHDVTGTSIERVQKLNRIVAQEATESILVAITQHIAYMRLLTSAPPEGPPAPVSNRQDKTAAYKSFL